MLRGRRRVALVVTTTVAALAAGSALAADVQNPSFENGLTGWGTDSNGAGQWSTELDPDSEAPLPSGPPVGDEAAIASQHSPSSNVLYQDVTLRAHRDHHLRLWLAYKNKATDFFTPHTLDQNAAIVKRGDIRENQQFRIDVMDPAAGLRSLQADDVLKRVFRTDPGERRKRDWFRVRADLSEFAGQTVRLRFAEVDNQGYFTVGLDGVRVKTTRR